MHVAFHFALSALRRASSHHSIDLVSFCHILCVAADDTVEQLHDFTSVVVLYGPARLGVEPSCCCCFSSSSSAAVYVVVRRVRTASAAHESEQLVPAARISRRRRNRGLECGIGDDIDCLLDGGKQRVGGAVMGIDDGRCGAGEHERWITSRKERLDARCGRYELGRRCSRVGTLAADNAERNSAATSARTCGGRHDEHEPLGDDIVWSLATVCGGSGGGCLSHDNKQLFDRHVSSSIQEQERQRFQPHALDPGITFCAPFVLVSLPDCAAFTRHHRACSPSRTEDAATLSREAPVQGGYHQHQHHHRRRRRRDAGRVKLGGERAE